MGYDRPVRVVVLASGSEGNACVVHAGDTALLIDGGIAPRTLDQKLAALGVRRLDGIVVTHAHADHVGHSPRIAARHGVPIHATESTLRAAALDRACTRLFSAREPFAVGALQVVPCPVPHDQAQVALRVEHGGRRVAVVTDLGEGTAALGAHVADVDVLLIEANHDLDLLARGPYPQALKRRVASSKGHLSNEQCAEIVRQSRASTVVLMHLSRTNNRPELARAVVSDALTPRRRVDLLVAPRRGSLSVSTRATQTAFAF